MQYWFGYSDPAMVEGLYETSILRQFPGLKLMQNIKEPAVLNFPRLSDRNKSAVRNLKIKNNYLSKPCLSACQYTNFSAEPINTQITIKNKVYQLALNTHQAINYQQSCFKVTARIGANDESELLHSVLDRVANATPIDILMSGKGSTASYYVGYVSVEKQTAHRQDKFIGPISDRQLESSNIRYEGKLKIGMAKAPVPAKLAHPHRLIARRSGSSRICFSGLTKNIGQLLAS